MQTSCNKAVDVLEKCIDLIDQLEELYSSIQHSKDIQSGVKYRIYNVVVDLRENIVEARMIFRECRLS